MTTNFIDVKEAQHCAAYFEDANVNVISLREAVAMTKKFKLTMQNGWPYQKTKGYHISFDSIEILKAQNGGKTSGLKIYFGEKIDNGSAFLELIIIATDEKKDDFKIPEIESEIDAASGSVAIGDTRPCPEWCGKKNVLNQP
jgi:hypothetical protein